VSKPKNRNLWCDFCGVHHDADAKVLHERRQLDGIVPQAIALIGVVLLIVLAIGIGNLVYSKISLSLSVLCISILPIFYYFGMKFRVEESFNFIYGWHGSKLKATHDDGRNSIVRLFRFGSIVVILTVPFFNNIYGEYLNEYVSQETYWTGVLIFLFGISAFFAATLVSHREFYKELYRERLGEIGSVIRQLDEEFIGSLFYFGTVRPVLIENLNDPTFLYLKIWWQNPEISWRTFVLYEINRILDLSEGREKSRILLGPSDLEKHNENLRQIQLITEKVENALKVA